MMNKKSIVSPLCHELMKKTIGYLFEVLEREANYSEHRVDLWKMMEGHKKFSEYRSIFD